MIPALILAAMVVVNSTADVKVPLQVTVGGQDNGAARSAAPVAFDATTLTGLVGVASALAYRWKKSDKHEAKFDDRTTVGTQTTMQTAESLKQTDKGIEEMLGSIVSAVGLIPGVPAEATTLIKTQLEAWQKDNTAYYENAPAKATDLSKDPVVKKLGEVQKITEKND